MKARVFVSLKSTVLDPQGQTIRSALNGLGSPPSPRCGRASSSTSRSPRHRSRAGQREIETVAHDVLANPVIEDYRVEFLD